MNSSIGIRARMGSVLALLLLCSAAQAASADWWIDIANDRVEKVRTELAQGEDPNAVNDKGQPSIMQAIRDGAWGVYDLLAAHRRLDPNVTNKTDETPLMYLAVTGQTERARALIAKGAQVNRLGWTPLHYAASKGHLEMVRLLLSKGAIVNAPAPDGTTALMMAAYAGSEPVARALLDAGADVTMRNLQKQDAADWARLKRQTTLAAKLDELSRKVQRQRERAAGRLPAPPGQAEPIRPGQPSEPEPAPARGGEAAGQGADEGSTSRYFDLDRFERGGEERY